MISLYDDYVKAYYGCDRKLASRIYRGREQVRRSRNASSWFGLAYYLWVDPLRALRDAIDRANNGEIKDPAVLGVAIEPGNCFIFRNCGSRKAHRDEDFFRVKRWLEKDHWGEKKQGGIPFDTIYCSVPDEPGNDRPAEQQGQICLFDLDRIIGFFLPEPRELFNPDPHKIVGP